jgi:hypothetical protein
LSLPISSSSSSSSSAAFNPAILHTHAAMGGAGAGPASASDAISQVFAQAAAHLSAAHNAGAAEPTTPVRTPLSSPQRSPELSIEKKRRLAMAMATPSKKFALDQSSHAQPYLDICSKFDSGTYIFNSQECHLSLLGFGNYSNCYKINAPAAMSGFVVKCFHETNIHSNVSSLRKMQSHALRQYNQLCSIGAPVALITNSATALTDLYTILEFIPTEIDPSSWGTSTFDNLDAPTKSMLAQVKSIFEMAFTHQIGLDLLPSNLRIKADGQVVITDFTEEPYDDDDFEIEMSKRLQFWSQHPSIQEFLIENLPQQFKELHLSVVLSKLEEKKAFEASMAKAVKSLGKE